MGWAARTNYKGPVSESLQLEILASKVRDQQQLDKIIKDVKPLFRRAVFERLAPYLLFQAVWPEFVDESDT